MIHFLNHWGPRWLETASWAVVQNTLFLGIVLLILRFLKKTPAKVRYLTAMTGLVKCLIPPFIAAPFLSPVHVLSIGSIANIAEIGYLPVAPSSVQSISPSLEFKGLLLLLWISAVLLVVLIEAVSNFRWRMILSAGIPIEAGNEIRVYQTDRIAVPMTIGLFKPEIYVPSAWDGWSPAFRRMILDHELAHIRRMDRLAQTFQMIFRALYFFHPLVWLLNRRLDAYREMACDDASTGANRAGSFEYSRMLLSVAENAAKYRVEACSASSLIRKRNELLDRIRYQLEGVMKPSSRFSTVVLVGLLLLLIVPLSWTQNEQPKMASSPVPAADGQEVKKDSSFVGSLFGILPDSIDVQKNLVYPEEAVKAGLEGKVVVVIVSDDKGLKEAKIVESSFTPGKDLGCEKAALDAVRKLKWTGKMKNNIGEFTFSGTFRIPVVFRLPR